MYKEIVTLTPLLEISDSKPRESIRPPDDRPGHITVNHFHLILSSTSPSGVRSNPLSLIVSCDLLGCSDGEKGAEDGLLRHVTGKNDFASFLGVSCAFYR